VISHLDGNVCSIAPEGAVIDVGGVGLAVQCTPATLARLRPGERARVPTSLVVREDSLTLYGFADGDERAVFELLRTASGVGPRLALAVLAVHTPGALRRAVATEDLAALMLVPGIGKKGAQRIVLELKDRLGATGPGPDAALPVDGGAGGRGLDPAAWRGQVQAGLTGLGWSPRDAEQAIAAVAADLVQDGHAANGRPVDTAAALRAALRKLSRT
jgi:Holliday junction DNA helicase RuvA